MRAATVDDSTIALLEGALSNCMSISVLDERFDGDPLRVLGHALLDAADEARPAPLPPKLSAANLGKSFVEEADETDRWTAARFIESLPLEHTIASALCVPAGTEEFDYCRQLTKPELLAKLRDARLEGLLESLWLGLQDLSSQTVATGAELSEKFAMDEGRTIALGGLGSFVKGLEALIGPALMAESSNGKRSLMKQMDNEHHDPRDGREEFESNNGVVTTSEDEWEFVATPDMERAGGGPKEPYAERYDREGPERALRATKPEWCRQPWPYAKLLAAATTQNAALEAAGYAPLVEEELVGGRLYTGPMARPKTRNPQPHRPASIYPPGCAAAR